MKESVREKMRQADLRKVLSDEAGRRVVGGIFHECGLWKAIFCGESVQAAAFQEGLRAVAVGLVNRIRDIDPMLVAQCEIDYRNFEREVKAMNMAMKESEEE